MNKFGRMIAHFINILIAASLAAMTLIVLGNVVLRNLFNSGFTWGEEIARYLLVWMVFLGAIMALKNKEHLSIDILPFYKLPIFFQKIIFILNRLIILLVVVLIFIGGFQLTQLNWDSLSPATRIPLGFVYGSLLVASLGMVIVLLIDFYQAFIRKNKPISEFLGKGQVDEGSDDK